MDKTYVELICDAVRKAQVGMPIYTKQLAAYLAKATGLEANAARAAVSVAIKRIREKKLIPELCLYQNGIYYRSAPTAFGAVGINREKLIADKYLLPDKGYVTGFSLLHELGLTTQMPREQTLATNEAKACTRVDQKLGVVIRPPRVAVNARNKDYLQTLDALHMLTRAPVDVETPYATIANHIRAKELRYDLLLALADKHYDQQTVLQLAHTTHESLRRLT